MRKSTDYSKLRGEKTIIPAWVFHMYNMGIYTKKNGFTHKLTQNKDQ